MENYDSLILVAMVMFVTRQIHVTPAEIYVSGVYSGGASIMILNESGICLRNKQATHPNANVLHKR